MPARPGGAGATELRPSWCCVPCVTIYGVEARCPGAKAHNEWGDALSIASPHNSAERAVSSAGADAIEVTRALEHGVRVIGGHGAARPVAVNRLDL